VRTALPQPGQASIERLALDQNETITHVSSRSRLFRGHYFLSQDGASDAA
jgi:hypothetical protein